MLKAPYIFLSIVMTLILAACGESLSPQELLARANEAYEAGNYKAAVVDAKAALREGGSNAEGRRLLADAYLAQASYADAVFEYEKSLSAKREPGVLASYTIALVESNQLEKLLKEDGAGRFEGLEKNAVVLSGLAYANGILGNQERSKELIEQAVANSTDNRFVRLSQARLMASVDREFEASQALLTELVADFPDYAEAHSSLGAIARLRLDSETAAAAYRRAAEINPLRLSDRLSLIAALLYLADLEAAKVEVAALESRIPEDPTFNYYQGRIALAEGDLKTGLERLEQTLSRMPKHPGALYYSGQANLQLGNDARARNQLGDFLAVNPRHIEARLALARLDLRDGNAAGSARLADGVLKDMPGNLNAMRVLAEALSAQGLHEDSARIYEDIIAGSDDPNLATEAKYAAELIRAGDPAGIEKLEELRAIAPDEEDLRVLLVTAYLSSGDSDAAKAEAESLIAESPESHLGYTLLGRIQASLGDDDAAAASFEKALELDPGQRVARLGSAAMALKAGRSSEAEQLYLDAVEVDPTNLESLLTLAEIQRQAGKFDELASTLEQAFQAHPDSLAARLGLAGVRMSQGQPGDGVALLTEVRDQHDDNPQLHRLLAGGFLALGENGSAVASGERLLALLPDNPEALKVLAVAEQADGDFDAAEKHILRALELRPDDVSARRVFIELLLAQNRAQDLEKALAAMPEEVLDRRDVQLARGRVALQLNDIESALMHLKAAQKQGRDTRSVTLMFNALLRSGDRIAAEDEVRSWLKEHPTDGVILQQYGSFLLAAGRNAEGAEQFEILLEMDPESVVVLNNLAWAYRKTDSEKALLLVDSALEKDPDNVSIMDTRSMVLLEKGDYREALDTNSRALDAAPDYPEFLYHKALILNASGEVEEAKALLERLKDSSFMEKDDAMSLLKQL